MSQDPPDLRTTSLETMEAIERWRRGSKPPAATTDGASLSGPTNSAAAPQAPANTTPATTKMPAPKAPAATQPAPSTPSAQAAPSEPDDSKPFRPVARPPMCRLCLLDDGSTQEGEIIRVRGDQLVIGRSDADVVIPHDARISPRHVELRRTEEGGSYRWRVVDLQSETGTYAMVMTAPIDAGTQFLIGSHRFRFDAPLVSEKISSETMHATVAWNDKSHKGVSALVPSIVEITPDGEGKRHPILQPEVWIGRDPQSCVVVLAEDPFVARRHARLIRDAQGRWRIEANKTINGVWVGITSLTVESAGWFQIGEQRFSVKVLA